MGIKFIQWGMRFLFVVGGSYKGFYLNQIGKVGRVDLIVFQQGIIYDFDYAEEYCGNGVVGKELIALSRRFDCPIVALGYNAFFGKREKCFIVCVNGKISIIPAYKNVNLYIHGKLILISNNPYEIENADKYFSFILLTNKKVQINSNKLAKNLFICDNNSVTRWQGKSFYKKFRKYCYFSLCFHKKMI